MVVLIFIIADLQSYRMQIAKLIVFHTQQLKRTYKAGET